MLTFLLIEAGVALVVAVVVFLNIDKMSEGGQRELTVGPISFILGKRRPLG